MPWYHRTRSNRRFRSATLIQLTPSAAASATFCPRRRCFVGGSPVILWLVPEVDHETPSICRTFSLLFASSTLGAAFAFRFGVGCSMLDVRCWMLDVGLRAPSGSANGAIGRSWPVTRGGLGMRGCAGGGGGGAWAARGAGGGKGLDRAPKVCPSVAGGLRAGVAGSGARGAPGSGPAWLRSRTAAEAWLLWPTDWFLDASLARNGPRLVDKAGECPYLWQKWK